MRTPIVATIHGANLLDTNKKSFYYFIEKFLLTQILYDALISVGSSFLKYPNKNKNIIVIPNGVNLQDFLVISHIKEQKYFKILFV
jgi:glycosyltransferase involved in cell wall biosynthesis